MPSWGGRIPAYQIWQIVAYVRSMNGEQPTSATALARRHHRDESAEYCQSNHWEDEMKPQVCGLAGVMAILLAFTACAGHQQSAIDPAGPQAGKIASLLWFFFAVLGLIFVIVMAHGAGDAVPKASWRFSRSPSKPLTFPPARQKRN